MGGESEGEGVPEGGQAAEEGNEGQEGDGRRDDDEVAGKGHVRTPQHARYLLCTLHARLRDGMSLAATRRRWRSDSAI
jgi:hypothetical protein